MNERIIPFKNPLDRDFDIMFNQLIPIIGYDNALEFQYDWNKMAVNEKTASTKRLELEKLYPVIMDAILKSNKTHLLFVEFANLAEVYDQRIKDYLKNK